MEIIGLSEEKIKEISKIKGEDDWVLHYRLKGYNSFINQSMPDFGPEIKLNFDDVIYYKNNEIDMDQIIEDFTPYITTIINKGTNNKLSFEDKEEIYSDTFFIIF